MKSNETGDEERSSKKLCKIHKKENPSSYKLRTRSSKALSQILNEFQFLETIELTMASSSENATSSRDGGVCFYMLIFKFGLRLPLSRFILAFLSYFDLASK